MSVPRRPPAPGLAVAAAVCDDGGMEAGTDTDTGDDATGDTAVRGAIRGGAARHRAPAPGR